MKEIQKNQDYLAGLNEQQRDAVLCPADIVFVSAGPGTGKTHMLTSKLVHVIATSTAKEKIVALSYTNTAARQLGERFHAKLRESGIGNEFSAYNGTIHSFCYRMLKTFYKEFNQIILDDEELMELAEDIRMSIEGRYTKEAIMDCLKMNPKDRQLFETVCRIKDALQVISIQDILTLFLDALTEDPLFRDWIRDQVTVVAVDEAQDLSELNYIILDKLLEAIPGLRIFLVGDPRQNIFEFNGGTYKNLHGFLSRHPRHEEKTLTITYRCGQAIADYVNGFRFTDCDNASLRSVSGETGRIGVQTAFSEREEASSVISEIIRIGNLNESAVICNSLKYLDELIAQLIERGIPYKVFGGRKILKRHIRFLNHILRIVENDNAYSIRKVAEYAGIDIVENGKKKKSKFFLSLLGQKILSLREVYAKSSFKAVVQLAITEILASPDDTVDIIGDYQAMLEFAEDYNTISEYLAAFATDRELFVRFYDSDYVQCPVPTEAGYLTLSTIHSAKGLEWKNVFIMGLSEGNFPNPYFCHARTPDEEKEFFNTEWKKMYVASTRAKDNLYLTYSRSINRKGYTFRKSPSRFINNQITL